ncbi:uncharacterized protein LOC113214778 isoform X2 [Frankliniella occidentalis]|uniref:Uncharacterized protein LOC113214778 isoform X2 n=1 Tax=Frankliniella occidentalis TaxID=133901 RepID=A0A9C6TZV5_FRAOC|nr:uncharacterized protein LOC113214778 isoform X2 [Frankliniella occidentalis]
MRHSAVFSRLIVRGLCRPLMRPNNAKSQSGRWRPRRQARRSRALTADMLILFVALLVQSVAGRSPAGSGGRRAPSISLQLYDLEPCKDEPGNLLVSNFTSVREKNGIYHYYAHVLLKKVLKFISKLEVNVTQCVDAVSYNTCSYLTTLRFTTAVCTLMTADSLPWSTMIKALYPSFRCPMAACVPSILGKVRDEKRDSQHGSYTEVSWFLYWRCAGKSIHS